MKIIYTQDGTITGYEIARKDEPPKDMLYIEISEAQEKNLEIILSTKKVVAGKLVNKSTAVLNQETAEHLESLRNDYIKTEIEKLYPQDIEFKIMAETIENFTAGQGNTKAFTDMMYCRKKIKEDSQLKDLQIGEKNVSK